MIDWRSSMEQTYEHYIVDPSTWKDTKLVTSITKCSISRDSSTETLGSASIDSTETMDECYIRTYLVAIQNGVTYRIPLGTHLVQTPGVGFDGKVRSVSMDTYTPLIELKCTRPPIGYSLLEGQNIMKVAYDLCKENMRAPVIFSDSDKKLEFDFVSNLDDTWMSFLIDLIYKADFNFGLDEMGRVIFEPIQDMAALQPVWTYDDGNSSILYPDFDDDRDLYDIPNVVEVVYSNAAGYKTAKVVNDDPSSPISTVSRGYEKVYRDTNPNFNGIPTQGQIDQYAIQLLKELSSLEHKISYRHAYCPVRIGDCVMLNYTRAGLFNVKAKVTSQSISCETGCPVDETAVYTEKLWTPNPSLVVGGV